MSPHWIHTHDPARTVWSLTECGTWKSRSFVLFSTPPRDGRAIPDHKSPLDPSWLGIRIAMGWNFGSYILLGISKAGFSLTAAR